MAKASLPTTWRNRNSNVRQKLWTTQTRLRKIWVWLLISSDELQRLKPHHVTSCRQSCKSVLLSAPRHQTWKSTCYDVKATTSREGLASCSIASTNENWANSMAQRGRVETTLNTKEKTISMSRYDWSSTRNCLNAECTDLQSHKLHWDYYDLHILILHFQTSPKISHDVANTLVA